jgi:hypothetical protein
MSEKENIKNIKNIVSIVIDNTFTNLILSHKTYLKNHLSEVCILLGDYLQFDNYIQQLKQNKYRDVYSLLVMLLPYYDINKSLEIIDLGELFYKKNEEEESSAKSSNPEEYEKKNLSSTYYYDHDVKTDDDIQRYLETSVAFIQRTFAIVCNKLTPNWLNVFPYTMTNYKESKIYLEFEQCRKDKTFPEYKYSEYYGLKLGYHTLYGVIKSFLYDDIKDIKWMIYDIQIRSKICPSILHIVESLRIQNIINEPWDKLSHGQKKIISGKWYKITNSDNFLLVRSLIMFYLRWERDNEKLGKIITDPNCLEVLKTNLEDVYNTNENSNEIYFYLNQYDYASHLVVVSQCIKSISHKIKIEDLYVYIYNCCQKFRYTWYGYCCLDENKKFLDMDTYYANYVNDSNKLKGNTLNDRQKFYITPKMTYNYFKAMLHVEKNNKYNPLSNTNSWDNLTDLNKKKFIDNLNSGEKNMNWFNIKSNISRIYNYNRNDKWTTKIHDAIKSLIVNSDWFSRVIFECLVYNGILTYFKYNPEATDNLLLPDKNKFKAQWQTQLLSHIKIEDYKESYHFLDNKKLRLHDGLIDRNMVKNSKWYTNFGADWIAQIQVFHHFINQRIMFVTGSTGAGKSTVYPFMMLYATKIINYNNNGKVFCTQPRIQPTVGNAVWMAEELGIPIRKEGSVSESDNVCNSDSATWIKSDIDYLQFKYSDASIADDLYHPTLRLLTDGYLYSVMKNDYILKKKGVEDTNKEDNKIVTSFTEKNSFDVLLIDESHEHNPYMDMILTMCKFAMYINNEITMGIISATMDDDESTYRNFFKVIDDNWKAPLKIDHYEGIIPYNRNRLDRRIHLSVPFGGMNFDVGVEENLKESEIEIVKRILSTSTKGDILIFKPGTSEIVALVEEMNANIPSNVLAIPFIGTLAPAILEKVIKQIANPNVRRSIRYPKNYTINQICDIPSSELLPEGTYTRFIIIATNIAEASITIDTLEYVIDDGKQKIMFYDVDTNQSKLIVTDIAVPNYKQRKGRVGRSQPGFAYLRYPISKLDKKVMYKMCSDNINDKILDLLSLSDMHFFTEENNPYLIPDTGDLTELDKIPSFLRNQYSFIDDDYDEIIYYFHKPDVIDDKNIIYPYSDGKYDLDTLIDESGKFYIIHPNETQLERNAKLEIIKRDDQYKNKVASIIRYFKILSIINEKNKITNYGQLMVSCVQLFELQIEQILTILDMLSFKYQVKKRKCEIFRNVIWYCVFANSQSLQSIGLPREKHVNSDFLAKAEIIPVGLLYIIDLSTISENLDDDLSNLETLVEREVSKVIELIPNYSSNYRILKEMLVNYYKIKIKIELLEELLNPDSTIIYYAGGENDFVKGQIKKNTQLLKNVNMKYLPKILDLDMGVVKSLNNYEQTCFFICKNMKVRLLLKITDTPYYINYFDRNFNNIYQISYFVSPHKINKKIIITNVHNDFRNNIIFYLSSDDSNKISNIMWIPSKILYLLQIINHTEIVRNNEINRKKIYEIHGKEENNISKKIDIINDYILNK